VVSAGRDRRRGAVLRDGSRICPADFRYGFSILCDPVSFASRATFFVDGERVRTERVVPFYIAGDFEGRVSKFRRYPEGEFTVRCELSDSTTVSARISVGC